MKQNKKQLRNGKRILLMKMSTICRRALTYAKWAWKEDKPNRYLGMRQDPFIFAQFDIANELTKIDYV